MKTGEKAPQQTTTTKTASTVARRRPTTTTTDAAAARLIQTITRDDEFGACDRRCRIEGASPQGLYAGFSKNENGTIHECSQHFEADKKGSKDFNQMGMLEFEQVLKLELGNATKVIAGQYSEVARNESAATTRKAKVASNPSEWCLYVEQG